MYNVITKKSNGLFCKETIYLDEKLCMLVFMIMIFTNWFCNGFHWSTILLIKDHSSLKKGHCQGDQDCIRIFSIIIDVGFKRSRSVWNLCLVLKRKK